MKSRAYMGNEKISHVFYFAVPNCPIIFDSNF